MSVDSASEATKVVVYAIFFAISGRFADVCQDGAEPAVIEFGRRYRLDPVGEVTPGFVTFRPYVPGAKESGLTKEMPEEVILVYDLGAISFPDPSTIFSTTSEAKFPPDMVAESSMFTNDVGDTDDKNGPAATSEFVTDATNVVL